MVKRRKKRSYTRSRTTKRKLAGFTKVKGKYALVFKKGKTASLGKGRFKSKKTMLQSARKYV